MPSNTELYRAELAALANAIYRCHNPKSKAWDDYGGRGIHVCDEWRSDRMAFVDHIGPKPSPHLTLDRIDNDKGYEPNNVRWATRSQQQRNQRQRVSDKSQTILTVNGTTRTLKEWSDLTGVKMWNIYWRLDAGFDPEQVISKAKRIRRK